MTVIVDCEAVAKNVNFGCRVALLEMPQAVKKVLEVEDNLVVSVYLGGNCGEELNLVYLYLP